MKRVDLTFKIPDDKECLNFFVWLAVTYYAKNYLVSIHMDDCVFEEDEE